MKRFFCNLLARLLPPIAAACALAACDSLIYEGEGEDCDPVHVVRFVYDMNLKHADAFPAEVRSVDLYVFDKAGRLAAAVSRDVDPAAAKDFAIELRGLEPGRYDLLAWCGVKGSKHFAVNHLGVADPALPDHTCRINALDEGQPDTAHVREDIFRLYHGRLDDVDMTQDEGHYQDTVYLTKDTNLVRVVLQHLSGAPMEKDDYDFRIIDHNGLYAADNSLMPHKEIVYHPWSVRSAEAAFDSDYQPKAPAARGEDGPQTSASAVVAEFTVGRLMADRKDKALLSVRRASDGREIIRMPLIQYMLMVKGEYRLPDGASPMGDQEFLDRQDEYPMTFFLDERDNWLQACIYIHSYRIVLNQSEIH